MDPTIPQPGLFKRNKVSQPSGGLRSVDSIGESYSAVWVTESELEDALKELEQQGPNSVELLQRIATQLSANPDGQKGFIAFGGIQTIEALLASDNPNIQLRALAVMEVLTENPQNTLSLLQTGVLSLLVHILTSPRYNGRRKVVTADVIKFLGGGQEVFEKPEPQQHLMDANFLYLTDTDNNTASSISRAQPLPVWCYSVDPIQPWDSEAIIHLVDILSQGGAGELESVLSHALTRITLVRSMGGPLVVEPPVMEALTALVYAMHPSLRSILHTVVALCVLHPLNEALFVRLGGVQALAFVGSCDTGGGAIGELSAWVLAFLASRSTEAAKRIGASDAVEVLVEMLYSQEVRTRQAATRAVCCLASSDRGKLAPVRRRLVRCNAVPGLLSVLQSAEHDMEVQKPLVLDVIRTFWKMRKVKECRLEMRGAGVTEALKQISLCEDSEVSLLAMQANLALSQGKRSRFGPMFRTAQCLGIPKLDRGPPSPQAPHHEAVAMYGHAGAAVMEGAKAAQLTRQRSGVFAKVRVKIRKFFLRLKLKTSNKPRLGDRSMTDDSDTPVPQILPQNTHSSYPPKALENSAHVPSGGLQQRSASRTPPLSRTASGDGGESRNGSLTSLQPSLSQTSIGSNKLSARDSRSGVGSFSGGAGAKSTPPSSARNSIDGRVPLSAGLQDEVPSAEKGKVTWLAKRQNVGYAKIG